MKHGRRTDWCPIQMDIGEDGKLREKWVCYGCVVMCVGYIDIGNAELAPVDGKCPYANTIDDPLQNFLDNE